MTDDFDIRQESAVSGEKDFENALRPLRFSDFSGQQKVVENLEVFVEAARYRGEPLDHTLLHGPPGLGKTTLSNIIANELGVGFKLTSGPVLDKPGDLAGILTSLEPRDVLFIDEIHRLSPVVEEYLYSAMEDYRIDIMIDKGPSARSIQIDLNPFTLVGATTRSGLLTAPLRARFGINLHLEYYEPETLVRIIRRSAGILNVPIDDDAAVEIARRSRGTPRIANRLLKRVRDFAQVMGNGSITKDIASVGKPATTDADGAMGWSSEGASSWAAANLQASTWNVELMHEMGTCIGEEALQLGLTGWYAPAVNIHRSPFSGRVYEYYSEDPLVSGKIAAGAISGAADKGCISYLKHYALNDQETDRYGFAVYTNEQAGRENSLRGFEGAMRDDKGGALAGKNVGFVPQSAMKEFIEKHI